MPEPQTRRQSPSRASTLLAAVFFVSGCSQGCDGGVFSRSTLTDHASGQGDQESTLVATADWEDVPLPLPPHRPALPALARVWNGAGTPCSAGVVIDPLYYPVKRGATQRNSSPDAPRRDSPPPPLTPSHSLRSPLVKTPIRLLSTERTLGKFGLKKFCPKPLNPGPSGDTKAAVSPGAAT